MLMVDEKKEMGIDNVEAFLETLKTGDRISLEVEDNEGIELRSVIGYFANQTNENVELEKVSEVTTINNLTRDIAYKEKSSYSMLHILNIGKL